MRVINLHGKSFLFIGSFLLSLVGISQERWDATNPFGHKVFIENKGQFDGKSNTGSSQILFSTNSSGVEVFFTREEITYRYDKASVRKKEDNQEENEQAENNSEVFFYSAHWIGANPAVNIIAEEEVSHYYSYADSLGNPIKAKGYSKIIYKNIYKNIDVEYFFPKNKEGIKYNIIVRPGADISKVRLQLPNTTGMVLNSNGDIISKSLFGDFVDHAPITTYENEKTILKSNYILKGNELFFYVDSYNNKKTIVIDPWVTNPTFAGYNVAYDVNFDKNGNVYAYGSHTPFKLAKFSPAGALLWVFNAAGLGPLQYGDFTVDENTGTSYLVEGYNAGVGSRALKVNTLGIQTAIFPGSTTFVEMWRAEYNSCTNKIVIGGGGTNTSNQTCMLDTNLLSISPVNSIATTNIGYHDIVLLTIDPLGTFAYMSTARSLVHGLQFSNEMFKVPIPALAPYTFLVPTGYSFYEWNSVTYVGGVANRANGYNGMTCSYCNLYSYDGNVLKKWNKNTGAFKSQVNTGGIMFSSGGLSVDKCDKVYVGIGSNVQVYDSSLVALASYSLSNTCADVKLGPNNKLYACGTAFVTEIDIPPITVVQNFTVTSTPSNTGCGGTCNGTATANIIACCNQVNYLLMWSPGGQTTQTITGLCPGNYTVTASTSCNVAYTATVAVTGGVGGLTPAAAFGSGPVCIGATTFFIDSTVAQIGDPIATWSWNFGDGSALDTLQNPSHIFASPGTYSVTLIVTTITGCADTISQTVTVNPSPVANFSSSIVCFNNPTVFMDLSTGAPIQWSWNFGDGNTSSIQNPTHTYNNPGTFSVSLTVSNAEGCSDSIQLLAIVNPLPTALFTSTSVCFGSQTCFTDNSTVNPGNIISWSWNFGDPSTGIANTSALQSPCHAFSLSGTFSVILTVTSDSGCQNVTSIPIQVYPIPAAAIVSQSGCLNAPTNFTDASTTQAGNAINAWNWNFGDGSPNDINQHPTHTYVSSGAYTVTLIVTTINGCKDTTTSAITIYQSPIALFSDSVKGCAPSCATFSDLSTSVDGTITSWQWSFPGGNPSFSTSQNPTICWSKPGSYNASLIVTSTYGCVDSISAPLYITIYDWPDAQFCVTPNFASITDPTFNFCDLWSTNVTNWMWNFGDGSSLDSTHTDPIHSYSATTTTNNFYSYTVTLTVQNIYGCWDTISKVIEILPEVTFYIPNTFTPNKDGTNDMFFGKGRGIKEYDIWIFDRWGNMIWDCHHTGKNTDWDSPGQDGLSSYCQWDGIVKPGGSDMNGQSGILMQEDVYVWKVSLVDVFSQQFIYVGNVNVVR